MKTFIRFVFTQLAEIWILATALLIVFVPGYIQSYSLLDLLWFYVTTFFAVLFVTILLSRSYKIITLGTILFSLVTYLLYFVLRDPSSTIVEMFTLPITIFEFLAVFLFSLTTNLISRYTDQSSFTQKIKMINRTLAIKVFAFVVPIVPFSLLFTSIDPSGVWSDKYILHVLVLGTLVTYLLTELLFTYRDKVINHKKPFTTV